MDIVRIGEAFTEAALDSSKWQQAMEVASASTGAFGAALFPIEGHIPAIPFSNSLGESVERYISEGWIRKDERYKAYPAVRQRGVGTDADFISIEGMKFHPYYQDFLGKHGLQWFAGVGMAHGTEKWCLSLNRSVTQTPFSSVELANLRTLSANLSGIVAMARSLSFAKIDAALAAFEASGSAVVMFDRFGSVSKLNCSAEKILRLENNLRFRKLVSHDQAANVEIEKALKKILWDTRPEASLGPILFPRQNRRHLLVHLIRLPTFSFDIFGDCRAVAMLSDLDESHELPASNLRHVFGLTNAEAKIAILLSKGQSLDEIAVVTSVSYETARNHLKSIFGKTGVKRQPELVAMMSRIRAPIIS